MEWVEKTPQYGDIVRTKVTFYYHYGIFVDENTVVQFGLPDNVRTPPGQVKVLTTDVYTFLDGGSVEVGVPDRREKRTMGTPRQIVEAALSRLGEGGYDLRSNNCLTFVEQCAFGTHRPGFFERLIQKRRGGS